MQQSGGGDIANGTGTSIERTGEGGLAEAIQRRMMQMLGAAGVPGSAMGYAPLAGTMQNDGMGGTAGPGIGTGFSGNPLIAQPAGSQFAAPDLGSTISTIGDAVQRRLLELTRGRFGF